MHEVSPTGTAVAIAENVEREGVEGLTCLGDGSSERCDVLVHLTPIMVAITGHTTWAQERVVDAQMFDLCEPR